MTKFKKHPCILQGCFLVTFIKISAALSAVVPREGIEPSIPLGPRILSPVRIPVPPPGQVI